VVFDELASNLVAGDSNGFYDIFRVANPFHVDSGVDTVQSSVSYTLPAAVENLTLTGTGDLNGTGNSQANLLTGNSGQDVVTLLWTNVMGSPPSTTEAQPFIDMLNGGMTTGQLGVLAADFAAVIGVVDLAALSQTGLAYV
jgi:hypothetical protein